MSQLNPGDFDVFDFYVLSSVANGSKSALEIQQRVTRLEKFLEMAARKRRGSIAPLPVVLERLQRAGWLQPTHVGVQPNADTVYSLTDSGKQRLEQERARLHLIVSEFVESSALDGSFQRFLDNNHSFESN